MTKDYNMSILRT